MNWYLQSGKDSDVVINTHITFSRNLRNFKFGTENPKEIQEIENLIKTNLPSLGYNLKFLKIKDMDNLTKNSLIEKGLVPEEINEYSSILINNEENICIVINSTNHIELQVFMAGMEIENAFNLAREIDEKLNKILDIAKSKKYGYLTTYPINVGTGLNSEVTIHLPGLTKTGNIRKISQTINNFGLNFIGLYVSGQEIVGDLYKICNKQTLGITEDTIIKNLKAIVEKTIEQERQARKILVKNQIELEDLIYRDFGILTNAKKLRWQETLELLSNVKMGVDLGLLDELNDEKIAKIYFLINPSNLQIHYGQNFEAYDRDIKRAEIIKEIVRS